VLLCIKCSFVAIHDSYEGDSDWVMENVGMGGHSFQRGVIEEFIHFFGIFRGKTV